MGLKRASRIFWAVAEFIFLSAALGLLIWAGAFFSVSAVHLIRTAFSGIDAIDRMPFEDFTSGALGVVVIVFFVVMGLYNWRCWAFSANDSAAEVKDGKAHDN